MCYLSGQKIHFRCDYRRTKADYSHRSIKIETKRGQELLRPKRAGPGGPLQKTLDPREAQRFVTEMYEMNRTY